MNFRRCTHDSDSVVEERLPEDEEVELHVDADLLKDGQHRHGVHRGDQGGEGQAGGGVELADHPVISIVMDP